MHDTIQNFNICTDGVCETNFSPRKLVVAQKPPVDEEADFATQYRHQLQQLKMQVTADYDDLKKKYQAQSKRIDALEGLVPCIRMQEHQLHEVSRDVRAMKRVVLDLQVAIEDGKRPFWHKLLARLQQYA